MRTARAPPDGEVVTGWRDASLAVMPNVATSGSSSSWRTTAMAASTPAVSVAAVSVRSSTESRSIVAAISASRRERLVSSRASTRASEASSGTARSAGPVWAWSGLRRFLLPAPDDIGQERDGCGQSEHGRADGEADGDPGGGVGEWHCASVPRVPQSRGAS